MNQLPSSSEKPRPAIGKRVLRWLSICGLLLGVTFIGLQYFPVYQINDEDRPPKRAVKLLKEIQAFQNTYLTKKGRYIGGLQWAEWPAGPFPSSDGVSWGQPGSGPWSELKVAAKTKTRFKFRVRAGLRPNRAPEAQFPSPPKGPWYVLQARADLDGDGEIWLIEVSSAATAIFVRNEGE